MFSYLDSSTGITLFRRMIKCILNDCRLFELTSVIRNL
jgi:hypothetical protein